MKVKQGATRNVLLIGKLAFKFPRLYSWQLFLKGLLANMQEALFSSAEDFPDLCPVLWHIPGGFLVCMRRAEPFPHESWEKMDVNLWLKARRLQGICEGKPDCFGIITGKLVIVDYGA